MKKFFRYLLYILLLLNLVIIISGNSYIYKALIYNYVDIDDYKIFSNRVVKAGVPQAWNISSAYDKKNISESLKHGLEEWKSVAFLVIKDDSICYEHYWDGYTDSSQSSSFSMAKSLVSILIGIALDEGKIKSLDEPVGDYIPEYKEGMNAQLTIRHLLTMSSGIEWDESYAGLFSPVTKAYYGTDLKSLMAGLKVTETPGKKWNYQSCDTQILGIILEKATGKSLSAYASEKIWIPVHAAHDAEWSLDHKDGLEKAYSAFYSNARDFARIGKLFLQKGKWDGHQIVSEKYVEESITPAPLMDDGHPNEIYGYQWWLTKRQGWNVFYMRGILGQYVFVIPDKKMIIVRLGKIRPEKNAKGELPDIPLYIDEVLKAFG